MDMFVNPAPGMTASHVLQFDFPADYHGKGCLPNINIRPPGIEQMYGKLGTPQKEQGNPCICESIPEAEDPQIKPFQDQVLDIDKEIQIDHTGRLSGSFVRYLASSNYHSKVSMYAHPVSPGGGSPIPLDGREVDLTPAGASGANVWYWLDPTTRKELLYTAHAVINPERVGLNKENVYKLVCHWSFWDHSIKPSERMPMSGFDEAVSFEVITGTVNL